MIAILHWFIRRRERNCEAGRHRWLKPEPHSSQLIAHRCKHCGVEYLTL